jgi:hypothetical protein
VEGPVVAGAVLLVVGVLLERAAEGGGVGARPDRQRPDASRMVMRGDPGHVAAPVVADQMERLTGFVGGIRNVEHILDQPVDPVGGQVEHKRPGGGAGGVDGELAFGRCYRDFSHIRSPRLRLRLTIPRSTP